MSKRENKLFKCSDGINPLMPSLVYILDSIILWERRNGKVSGDIGIEVHLGRGL